MVGTHNGDGMPRAAPPDLPAPVNGSQGRSHYALRQQHPGRPRDGRLARDRRRSRPATRPTGHPCRGQLPKERGRCRRRRRRDPRRGRPGIHHGRRHRRRDGHVRHGRPGRRPVRSPGCLGTQRIRRSGTGHRSQPRDVDQPRRAATAGPAHAAADARRGQPGLRNQPSGPLLSAQGGAEGLRHRRREQARRRDRALRHALTVRPTRHPLHRGLRRHDRRQGRAHAARRRRLRRGPRNSASRRGLAEFATAIAHAATAPSPAGIVYVGGPAHLARRSA